MKRIKVLFLNIYETVRVATLAFQASTKFVLNCLSWCPIFSALCSGPWESQSPTIHLKTASWPWQKASWDCQSTPVCWNMPSWSGDWGESLNTPIQEKQTLQGTPDSFHVRGTFSRLCIPRNTAGRVHRWEGSWGFGSVREGRAVPTVFYVLIQEAWLCTCRVLT